MVKEIIDYMAYVITEPCLKHKDSRCVNVCPENAIQTFDGSNQYFIDPDKCTDCGICDLACPVAAIFPEELVPPNWKHYIEINKHIFLKNDYRKK